MENELSKKQGIETLLGELDLRVGATLLPSGRIFKFPMADLEQSLVNEMDSGAPRQVFDTPSTELEKTQAEILTSVTRVPPIFARVFVRQCVEAEYIQDSQPSLPPLNRIVFVPL